VAARVGQFLAVAFGVTALLWTGNPIHVALAAFIYLAARAEEAQVLSEDRGQASGGQGIWTAPPGYYWVSRGNGLWQLAPIGVDFRSADGRRSAPPWR
jgi:hypothetical protein